MPGPVKHVERSASIAFSSIGASSQDGSSGSSTSGSHCQYLAAGTMAGAIDLSFSTSSVLELFAVDVTDDQGGSTTMPRAGRSRVIQAPERFNSLIWSMPIDDGASTTGGLGIIAGGLVDGRIIVVFLVSSAIEIARI